MSKLKQIIAIVVSILVLTLYFEMSRRYSYICQDSLNELQNTPFVTDMIGSSFSVKWFYFDEKIGKNHNGKTTWYCKYIIIGTKKMAVVETQLQKDENNAWVYEMLRLTIGENSFSLLKEDEDR